MVCCLTCSICLNGGLNWSQILGFSTSSYRTEALILNQKKKEEEEERKIIEKKRHLNGAVERQDRRVEKKLSRPNQKMLPATGGLISPLLCSDSGTLSVKTQKRVLHKLSSFLLLLKLILPSFIHSGYLLSPSKCPRMRVSGHLQHEWHPLSAKTRMFQRP